MSNGLNEQRSSLMEDAQILQQIKSGNTDAYKQLILKYESLVANTVIGMIGHCSEAEDIGQEVFIRFYKAIDNFRGDSTIGTYLTRIAINLSINELKRRKRKSLFFKSNNDRILDVVDTGSKSDYDDSKELVQKAIQKLESKFRSVIVLRLIDGYSTEETAKILNIPLGTVLSRLSRGQQKLKEILSPLMEINNG